MKSLNALKLGYLKIGFLLIIGWLVELNPKKLFSTLILVRTVKYKYTFLSPNLIGSISNQCAGINLVFK